MNFQRFAELSDMLIDGMESSIRLSHGEFSRKDFAVRVGEMVLAELEKDDNSPDKIWTEQQAPGLRLAIAEKDRRTEKAILKLSAPGLIALSAESGDNLKNLAYHVCFNAYRSLLGEAIEP
ncbi:MAG: hypothetical protein SPL61_11455 [Saccharofermentans sp.]|nr:hypothetical protein [Saccharofermentans sp.]